MHGLISLTEGVLKVRKIITTTKLMLAVFLISLFATGTAVAADKLVL